MPLKVNGQPHLDGRPLKVNGVQLKTLKANGVIVWRDIVDIVLPQFTVTTDLKAWLVANHPSVVSMKLINNLTQPSIITGDLAGLTVELENNGEIQGTTASERAFQATSPIKLTNKGWIRGAGGNGGIGGNGGLAGRGGKGANGYITTAQPTVVGTPTAEGAGIKKNSSVTTWLAQRPNIIFLFNLPGCINQHFANPAQWRHAPSQGDLFGIGPCTATPNQWIKQGTYRGNYPAAGNNVQVWDILVQLRVSFIGGAGGTGGTGGSTGGAGGTGRTYSTARTNGVGGANGAVGVVGSPSVPAGGNSGGRGGTGGNKGNGGNGGNWGTAGGQGIRGTNGATGAVGAGGGAAGGTGANGITGTAGGAAGAAIVGSNHLIDGSDTGNVSGAIVP